MFFPFAFYLLNLISLIVHLNLYCVKVCYFKMVTKLWCFLTFIFYVVSITVYPNVTLDSTSLKAVNVFFRHGARTPLVVPELKSKFGKIHWSDGPGILTKVGKQKMFELGNVLRRRYKNFLSPYYFPGEIYVSSTPVERTKNSMKSLLAGLYNTQGFKFWSDKIPATLVPIAIDDNVIDKSMIINSQTACPLFKSEQKKAVNTATANDKGFKDVYTYLSLFAGKQISGMYDIFTTWDILECLAHNNRKLPYWASPVYPEKMSQITAKVLRSLIVGTDKMLKIVAGPYINELHKQFTEVAEKNSSQRKFVIHGGHDFSMTANLGGLGTFEKIVNPGDAIIMELHEIPFAGFFVQMLYAEAGGSNISVMKIGNCGQPCSLHSFIEITKDVIPANWVKECTSYL